MKQWNGVCVTLQNYKTLAHAKQHNATNVSMHTLEKQYQTEERKTIREIWLYDALKVLQFLNESFILNHRVFLSE